MGSPVGSPVRRVGRLLQFLGTFLVAIGAGIGWGLPLLSPALATRAAALHIDLSGYLGADITALAVIIAVVIGFNASALQIGGQTHALTIIRGILLTMVPFFVLWGITTCVALDYFLQPPVYATQLWQMLVWFVAIVILMLGYTFELPWLVSGSYVAEWALRELRGRQVERWESLDGFSALLSAIAAASARGDLGTLRAMTSELGAFLCGRLDPRAEQERGYRRERYRALKNLLSGCAQNGSAGPNSVAYHLGYVLAGVLLQGIAVGLPLDDPTRDFYSGLFRGLRSTPERVDPLWTGARHALCRYTAGGQPFLLRYWEAHRAWSSDDPRAVEQIAGALAQLHVNARKQMALSQESGATVSDDAASMLSDLYRDISLYLAREAAEIRHREPRERALAHCASLLDAVHTRALASWALPEGDAAHITIIQAYEERREELRSLIAGNGKR